MPTGYTAMIGEDDCTFSDFVFKCAQNFVVFCREHSYDLRYKTFSVHDETSYYREKISCITENINELESTTLEDIKKIQDKEKANDLEDLNKYIEKQKSLKAKYISILKKVEAWEAPESCKGLKAFMSQQIKDSISFDIGDDYDSYYLQRKSSILKNESPEEYKAKKLSDLRNTLSSYEKEVKRQEDGVMKINSFLNDLRDSLKDQE